MWGQKTNKKGKDLEKVINTNNFCFLLKINKANRQVFETMCKQKLLKDPNIIDQIKHFTENLSLKQTQHSLV